MRRPVRAQVSRCAKVPASDREFPRLAASSGTQRARDLLIRRSGHGGPSIAAGALGRYSSVVRTGQALSSGLAAGLAAAVHKIWLAFGNRQTKDPALLPSISVCLTRTRGVRPTEMW
jgi:hypothetical protein